MIKLPRIKYDDLTLEKIQELNIELWGEESAEHLQDSEIDDAIESALDRPPGEEFPETIEVWGYARQEVNPDFDINMEQILEDVLEHLDETYGGLDTESKPTEKMIDAAARFARVVAEEYFVWACEGVLEVEVDVRAWIKEHNPEWLKEDK